MNKRTKKKLTKRLNCKTYLGYRKKLVNNDNINTVADYLLKHNMSKPEVDGIIGNFIWVKHED